MRYGVCLQKATGGSNIKRHHIVIGAVILCVLALVYIGIQVFAPAPPQTGYVKITPEEAQSMMSGDVVVLDVRTKEEYDELRLANAVLLPDYEIREQAEHVLKDKNQTILVYCRTGRRSEKASKILIELGYTKVYDIGGLTDWRGEVLRYNRIERIGYNFIDSDYVVEPFTFTTTQKIHDDLPEFEFRILGTRVLEYDLRSNDSAQWSDDFIRVYKLIITTADGSFNQEFSDLDTRNHLVTKDSPGLSFDDWNFDGYTDVSLWKWVGGTSNNVPHYYWLWDQEKGEFVANEELERISDYSRLEIDKENNRLISYSRDGAWMTQTEYYEYQDGQFELVK